MNKTFRNVCENSGILKKKMFPVLKLSPSPCQELVTSSVFWCGMWAILASWRASVWMNLSPISGPKTLLNWQRAKASAMISLSYIGEPTGTYPHLLNSIQCCIGFDRDGYPVLIHLRLSDR